MMAFAKCIGLLLKCNGVFVVLLLLLLMLFFVVVVVSLLLLMFCYSNISSYVNVSQLFPP